MQARGDYRRPALALVPGEQPGDLGFEPLRRVRRGERSASFHLQNPALNTPGARQLTAYGMP